MDNNYNGQMYNQVNDYQQNAQMQNMYQQNAQTQNVYQQNAQVQNMYQQNMQPQNMQYQNIQQANAYPQGMYQKKKIDVKGLIITVICFITSLMTSISVLMPIVKVGKDGMSVVEIFVEMKKYIENLAKYVDEIRHDSWYAGSFNEVGFIIDIVAVVVSIAVPITLAVMGLIISITLLVKLVTMKYKGREVFSVSKLLKFEMFVSIFASIYIQYQDSYNVGRYTMSGLSIGWKLPVIMCICTMVFAIAMEYAFNLKEKKFDKTYTVNGILAIISMIFASMMYIAFTFTQVVVTGSYSTEKRGFSRMLQYLINSIKWPKNYWDGKYIPYMVWVCISMGAVIIIGFLASMTIKKSMVSVYKGKFGGVINIVTGLTAIVLYLVEFIMGKIVNSDEKIVGSYNKLKVKMGSAGYMYIIFGALLIIVGIVQLCLKTYQKNKDKYAKNPYNAMAQQSNMVQAGYMPQQNNMTQTGYMAQQNNMQQPEYIWQQNNMQQPEYMGQQQNNMSQPDYMTYQN